jgi:tetratricopeptide (TPR) repeat protein
MTFKSDSKPYNRALALHAVGEIDQAIVELQQQLKRSSEDGQAWELLGVLAYARVDLTLAQSATEEASLRIPLSPRGQLVLAKCYDHSGHREAAAAIYRHVATLDALDVDLYEPLASGLGACGEYERALHVCRQAAQRMPDRPAPLVGIVHYMRRLRRPIQLILPVMFRVHHLEPDNAEYRITLACLLHEAGRAAEGAALLRSVAHEEFSCVRCLTRMQHIFDSVGDVERAAVCRSRLSVLAGQQSYESDEPTVLE